MAERIGEGVDDRRWRSDRARFATALDAERIGRANRLDRVDLERGQVVGARHAIVHEARRQELAVIVVMRAFEQRLAHALSDAAVHLALDDHRVDELAEVVDGGPTVDRDDARLRVDLELADMDTGREGEVGRIPESAFLEPWFEFLAVELVPHIGLQRDRAEVDRFVSALDGELAVLEFDIPFRGLKAVACDLLGFGFDLVERLENRRHADGAGPGAIGAHAHLHLVGVSVDDRYIFHGDAEATGDELSEGGLMALTMAVRARQNLDRADRIDAHFRRLPKADAGAERANCRRRRNAASFDVGGDPEASKFALSRGSRFPRRQALVVGDRQRLIKRARVIARVIGHDDRRLVRERIDEILPPKLGRILPGFTRRDLDNALDDERRLWATEI